jgi:hypothetical protein
MSMICMKNMAMWSASLRMVSLHLFNKVSSITKENQSSASELHKLGVIYMAMERERAKAMHHRRTSIAMVGLSMASHT